jgi:uncharacterized damage-inducible protein DinB
VAIFPVFDHAFLGATDDDFRRPAFRRPQLPHGQISAPRQAGTRRTRARAIESVAATPARLRDAVRGLTAEQIETPYRPGGWTVRQVIHHVPDSHLNAYCRFKLALTENEPTIKPYDEAQWALLPDVKAVPIETSLALLEAVHERWVAILRAMKPSDFERTLIHPEAGRQSLDQVLALYAWHGPHHTAHVTALRERMGW